MERERKRLHKQS